MVLLDSNQFPEQMGAANTVDGLVKAPIRLPAVMYSNSMEVGKDIALIQGFLSTLGTEIQVVSRAKAKYESALEQLNELMKKRDEIRKKQLIDPMASSERSF